MVCLVSIEIGNHLDDSTFTKIIATMSEDIEAWVQYYKDTCLTEDDIYLRHHRIALKNEDVFAFNENEYETIHEILKPLFSKNF